MKDIDGLSLTVLAAGGLFTYAGFKGYSIPHALQAFISGKAPTGSPDEPITSSGPSASSPELTSGTGTLTRTGPASEAANQAIGRLLAAPYGWATGTQWQDLVSLWNQESGWNNYAQNPSSGAYGIAQALPPTKYPAAGQASGGSSASAQISWGLNYIKQTYGSPSAAWAHEQADNWY